jgi:hypothetical protein
MNDRVQLAARIRRLLRREVASRSQRDERCQDAE